MHGEVRQRQSDVAVPRGHAGSAPDAYLELIERLLGVLERMRTLTTCEPLNCWQGRLPDVTLRSSVPRAAFRATG